MDKNKFLYLLTNSASLTEDETKELSILQDKFQYSQAIHNLLARGAQLNNSSNKQSLLSTAAVYATDRTVLKAIVTALPGVRETKPQEIVEEIVVDKKKLAETPKSIPEKKITAPSKAIESLKETRPVESPPKNDPAKETKPVGQVAEKDKAKPEFKGSKLEGDALIDELFHDLDKLKKLKHDFEIAVAQFDKLPVTQLEDIVVAPIAKEEKSESEPREKTKKNTEGIIAEIKSSKKKIKPSDPKQKEQLDIINQFIKSEPLIGKNKGSVSNPDTTDLSENSSVFSDNIVSETLVEILIKQGKKEKAVEVLKKLIWKFPQKKAYFAAQIEELTS